MLRLRIAQGYDKLKDNHTIPEEEFVVIIPACYEDIRVMHLGTEAERAYFIPASCRMDDLWNTGRDLIAFSS